MSVLARGFSEAFTPEDNRPACEWGAEFVRPPQSARSSQFDVSTTPWLREPINLIPDNRYKEIVCLMPTGAGKTTIFDVSIPRAIKHDPGSVLITMQNDVEADGYWEERLIPILEAIEDIDQKIKRLPRAKKKRGFIAFPHMTLYCSSAKWKALQRKSVRYVFLDEAWMMAHGFIGEARARTHDRWNQRVVIVSQGGSRFVERGGEIVLSELEEAWSRTDRREYSMVCPECGHVSPWKQSQLVFENAETPDGEIDERAVIESARYKCPGPCATEFEDKIEIRRRLATESVYVPTNERSLPKHVGFHVNGYALYYVSWGERALRWKRANVAKRQGDLEPLKILIQKDFAEFWEEHEHRFSGFKSDAPKAEYVITEDQDRFPGLKPGFPWEEEHQRFLVADRQELDGGYFVAGAAAFSKTGQPRFIWAGRINSKEELRAKQIELGISGRRVGIDCAHDTPFVSQVCSQYDWLELLGSDRNDWPHTQGRNVFKAPWSKPERILGVKNSCWRALWSNDFFHDLHAQKLGGGKNPWKVPGDIEDFATYIDPATAKPTGFWPQMRANQKVYKENAQGKRESKWIKIGKRPDHYRDVCCMLLVMAAIGGCLGHTFERENAN